MSEPTYEELKARLSQLEKEKAPSAPARWNSASEKKAASAFTASAAFPSRSITNNGFACSMFPRIFATSSKRINPPAN